MSTQIMTYDAVGMSAIDRCDRCGAQAYVEVMLNKGGTLMFCAHHTDEHEDQIMALDAVIADHRPFLEAQEEAAKQGVGLPK